MSNPYTCITARSFCWWAFRTPGHLVVEVDQVLVQSLLLDEHMGGGDRAVDEAVVVRLYLHLEGDELRHALHAQHIGEQDEPEGLTLALLMASAFPWPVNFAAAARFSWLVMAEASILTVYRFSEGKSSLFRKGQAARFLLLFMIRRACNIFKSIRFSLVSMVGRLYTMSGMRAPPLQ